MWYYRFPKYVSVAEKREKAERKLRQLKKKNPAIQPVVISGRSLATTWWGKAWDENLERYADYSYRLERGRSYVRHRAVLDLKIAPCEIISLVQGSERDPYEVIIKVNPLKKIAWNHIKKRCEGKIDSLFTLLNGRIPEDLMKVFMEEGKGLFPKPSEIEFSCSCPDWASMCKHVAATLYGVGARLDQEPALFFKLRKVSMGELVSKAVKSTSEKLISKSRERTAKNIIAEENLSDLFGIELDTGEKPIGRKGPQKTGRKIQAKKEPAKTGKETLYQMVIDAVGRTKKGVAVQDILKKTGLRETQVRNILFRAKQNQDLASVSRGVYKKI